MNFQSILSVFGGFSVKKSLDFTAIIVYNKVYEVICR